MGTPPVKLMQAIIPILPENNKEKAKGMQQGQM
jgi:hypothetical protein